MKWRIVKKHVHKDKEMTLWYNSFKLCTENTVIWMQKYFKSKDKLHYLIAANNRQIAFYDVDMLYDLYAKKYPHKAELISMLWCQFGKQYEEKPKK